MAGAKMSPRQRMINMMYLVLTALLALNVSKEVLNSFFEVNRSIVKTTDSFKDKNDQAYRILNSLQGEQARPYKELSNKVGPWSDDLFTNIQSMKYKLVLAVDGYVYLGENSLDPIDNNPIDSMKLEIPFDSLSPSQRELEIVYLSRKDDRNSSDDIFNPFNKPRESNITDSSALSGMYFGQSIGEASQLRVKINNYRISLLSILDEAEKSGLNVKGINEVRNSINTTLEIKHDSIGYGKDHVNWENYNFHDMPAVGALTLLSKWQADIKNMESEIITFLADNINASSVSFQSVGATTIPSSNFVLKGDEFSSDIFLTAFNKTDLPEVFIGEYDSLPNGELRLKIPSDPLPIKNGKGVYNVKGSSVGEQEYKGFIRTLQGDGYKYYPFNGTYLVADKSFAVSATQMNVLYANDIENPIQVSVAGYQPEDIKVTFGSGTLSAVNRKKGEYIVKPSQDNVGKEVNISVSVKKKDGSTQSIGKSVFRVKNVPGQTIGARYSDGTHSKNKVIANTFSSKIKDFDFPIKFYVSEFTVVCIGSKRIEKKVKGYKMSEEARKEIEKLEKGQTVLFKDFVVKQKSVPTYIDRPKDKFELIIE